MGDERAPLERTRTNAGGGFSPDPGKNPHRLPAQLIADGYRVIPVHRTAAEIMGRKAYPTLADVPEPIDLVNVFRPSGEAEDVTRQAVDAGAKAVWLQLGIASAEARRVAEDAGIDY